LGAGAQEKDRPAERPKELGVERPNSLAKWVERAKWSAGGLRHHLAAWADRGVAKGKMPG